MYIIDREEAKRIRKDVRRERVRMVRNIMCALFVSDAVSGNERKREKLNNQLEDLRALRAERNRRK